jgi:hypothetical protein
MITARLMSTAGHRVPERGQKPRQITKGEQNDNY